MFEGDDNGVDDVLDSLLSDDDVVDSSESSGVVVEGGGVVVGGVNSVDNVDSCGGVVGNDDNVDEVGFIEGFDAGPSGRSERFLRGREGVERRKLSGVSGEVDKVVYDVESDGFVRGGREVLVDGDGAIVSSDNVGDDGFVEFVGQVEDGGGVVELSESDDVVLAGGESGVVGNSLLSDSVRFPFGSSDESRVRGRGLGSIGGRVSDGECGFFERLGASKSRVLSDSDVRGLLRGDSVQSDGGVVSSVVGREVLGGLAEKDFLIIEFLARFRYSKVSALSCLLGVADRSIVRRLGRLRGLGLVECMTFVGNVKLWFLTSAGMVVSGFDCRVVSESTISLSGVPHQLVVNYLAGNLICGGLNVLNLEGWPLRLRKSLDGELVFGEEVVSEGQIFSNFSSVRGLGVKSEVYRPIVMSEVDRLFGEYFSSVESGDSSVVSPELVAGNEFLWVLFPPSIIGKVYHVPDLVVARERGVDGSPRSIAIEVETVESGREKRKYLSTLESYAADDKIYGKVVWVCKRAGTARLLEEIARDVGLWGSGRFDVVPILTRDGVFKGKDLWRL